MQFHRARSAMAALVIAAVAMVQGVDASAEGFAPTGNMSGGGRFGAGDALLPDGRVLIAGGINGSMLASADIWDPATGVFTLQAGAGSTLSVARAYATVTKLGNGKFLYANGGDNADCSVAYTAADLYDPSTHLFAATGSTHDARHGSTATLLGTGKVLVAGGIVSNDCPRLATAELYDPTAGTFAYTGAMHVAREIAVAVKLGNGKVLIAGGGDGSGVSLASTEIYDPTAGTFAVGPTMVGRRDDATATLLPDGRVLIVGGINNDIAVGTAEIYDPTANAFTASQSSVTPRRFHTATLLPNGKVLIAGGVNSDTNINTVNTAALYDPASDTFTPTGSMQTARFYHTATLLQDGRVLVAGGYNDLGVVGTAEIYGAVGDPIFADGFDG